MAKVESLLEGYRQAMSCRRDAAWHVGRPEAHRCRRHRLPSARPRRPDHRGALRSPAPAPGRRRRLRSDSTAHRWTPGRPAALAAENVHVSVRGSSMRVTPHLYNTDDDVNRLLAVLERALD